MPKSNGNFFDSGKLKALLPGLLLILLIYMAFSIRMYSAYRPYYPDIDTYYIFRMSNEVLTNNFHVPAQDALRYYPTPVSPRDEYTGIYYFPTATYALLRGTGLLTESYANFSWWFPALIGAISLIPMYFIGKIIHSRMTGLFAAFFFAVTPAILSRNSAWYVEKEVQAALFMLLSLYFFIRAMKNSSILSSAISGMALFVFASMWGGVQQLLIGIPVFILLVLLVDKAPQSLYRVYPALFIFGIASPTYFLNLIRLTDVEVLLGVAALGIMGVRYFSERFSLVPKEKIRFVVPAIYASGFLFLIIGSFFSPMPARLIATIDQFLFFHHGVISSTVAENIPPDWGSFANQLGAAYAQGALPSLATLIKNHVFDMWALAFLGIFVLLYRTYEKRDKEFWLANLASVLLMYSFWAFLKAGEAAKGSMQAIFVVSFTALLILVSRKKALSTLMLSLLFVAMLGSMSKIRVIFLAAPFLAIIASYGMASIIKAVSQTKFFRPEGGNKINVFSLGGLILLSVYLYVNFTAASVMGHNMGALYNQNWDSAMNYMKTQTPNDSVILSWWDYGYWFQTMSGRATNLDGGNGIANRNIPTAQFFTGMMNETEQKFFLEKMGTSHVLVDASMIGKYAALSKIANYGNKIDSYLQFGAAGAKQEGNTTVVAYSAYCVPGYSAPCILFVPIDQNGGLAGNVVLSLPDGGEGYIASLCTENGIVSLNAPAKNKIEGCMFTERTIQSAFNIQERPGFVLFASKEVSESVFTKLFFMDGKGLPYLDKVFDNGEVKIYDINEEIKRVPREGLLPWWDKHFDGGGLRVFDGKNRILQKAE